MRRRWIGFVLLVIWSTTLGGAPAASAEDEAPTPLQKAVAQVMTRLMKQKEGLCVGVTHRAAIAAAKGASHMAGQYYTNLRSTTYAPAGDWQGTVGFFVDVNALRAKRDVPLKNLEVMLLCPKYDKKAMVKLVLATGRTLGLSLELDDDEADLYWDWRAEGRDVWVSLGDEIINFEVNLKTVGDGE